MIWEPIETGPTDRDVLLAVPKLGVVRGRWNDDKYKTKPRPYWSNDRERWMGTMWTRQHPPTHWMPLPDMPHVPNKEMTLNMQKTECEEAK